MSERRRLATSSLWPLALVTVCALPALAHAQGDGTTTPAGESGEPPPGDVDSAGSSEPDKASEEEEPAAEDIEAQLLDATGIPEYHRIRTPTSPAFTILGVAPSEIQHPATPRDFALALSNSVQDSDDLTVPRNLALEFAPYWWFRHGRLTFDEYQKAGFGSNLLRNLSFSVGTTSRDVPVIDAMGMQIGTSAETRLAAGARTQLYTGESAADVCAGRVQIKAAALAREFLKKTSDAEKTSLDKLILARAERSTWERVLKLIKELEKAKKQLDKARKALGGPHATPAERQAAADAVMEATEAKNEVDKELAELRAQTQRRADAAAASVTAGTAALAKFPSESGDKKKGHKKAPQDKEKQAAAEDLARRKGRKKAADRALEIVLKGSSMTVAAIEKELEEARSTEAFANTARQEASEKRKEDEKKDVYKSRLKEMVELCKDASTARVGWIVSVAGASAWIFPDSQFSGGELQAIAGWLTVAHTWRSGTTLAGVIRGAWSYKDERDDTRALSLDTGARVIQARGKFAVSAELVGRAYTDQFVGVRAAIVGEYMVSKGSWLSISFGKDFSNDEAIFTLANLQWGMGGEARLRE